MPPIPKKPSLADKIKDGMRRRNALDRKREKLREQLWPGSSEWIWDWSDKEKVKGFASVPRVLPYVLHLIKHLARDGKGGDPSPVYLELWCRDRGQGIIEIVDEEKNAFAAGYASNRAGRTWREHMFKLVEMGFILAQPSGNREYGQVLLLNPLAVCRRIHDEGRTPEGWWAEFVAYASEIDAKIPAVLDLTPKPKAKPEPEDDED